MARVVIGGAVSALVLVLLGLTAEGILRLANIRPPGSFTNLRYENDPASGPWALPSQVGFLETPCYRVDDIHINRFGMRDRERELRPAGRRIALIGDSLTQGLQVSDDQTVSRQLEHLLGGGH